MSETSAIFTPCAGNDSNESVVFSIASSRDRRSELHVNAGQVVGRTASSFSGKRVAGSRRECFKGSLAACRSIPRERCRCRGLRVDRTARTAAAYPTTAGSGSARRRPARAAPMDLDARAERDSRRGRRWWRDRGGGGIPDRRPWSLADLLHRCRNRCQPHVCEVTARADLRGRRPALARARGHLRGSWTTIAGIGRAGPNHMQIVELRLRDTDFVIAATEPQEDRVRSRIRSLVEKGTARVES